MELHKVLISRDGKIVNRFESTVEADDTLLVRSLEGHPALMNDRMSIHRSAAESSRALNDLSTIGYRGLSLVVKHVLRQIDSNQHPFLKAVDSGMQFTTR